MNVFNIYNTIGLFEYLIKSGNIHTIGTLKKYSKGILC